MSQISELFSKVLRVYNLLEGNNSKYFNVKAIATSLNLKRPTVTYIVNLLDSMCMLDRDRVKGTTVYKMRVPDIEHYRRIREEYNNNN